MKSPIPYLLLIAAALSSACLPSLTAHAQGTAFTYNGRLADGGAPATGIYDLRFAIYDAVTNGAAVGDGMTNAATPVTNGLFTVTLDFGGGVFTGANRWLEIAVRTNGGGAFAVLNPRQPVLPVPYAIYAENAGSASIAATANSVPAAGITGTLALPQLPGAVLTNYAIGVSVGGFFNGTFFGDGSGLTNLNPASLVAGYVAPSIYFTNPFNAFNGFFNGTYFGNGNGLTNINPASLASGYVAPSIYFTNPFNAFNGFFNGTYFGNGNGLTNLNPASLVSGYVAPSIYFTNPFNSFNGFLNGTHFGDGNGLTNLTPASLVSGYVAQSIYFTNPFNSFNGFFNGTYFGNGNGLTNLNPASLVSGYVAPSIYFTNPFNSFNGFLNGTHFGDGSGLTNINPASLVSGYVAPSIYFTNPFNGFSGFFNGTHFGDGGGLTNLPVEGVTGGLTANISVLVPGGGTNILCFTNGILRAIQ